METSTLWRRGLPQAFGAKNSAWYCTQAASAGTGTASPAATGALLAAWAREASSGAKRTRIRSAVSAGVSASQRRRRTPGSAYMGTEV